MLLLVGESNMMDGRCGEQKLGWNGVVVEAEIDIGEFDMPQGLDEE